VREALAGVAAQEAGGKGNQEKKQTAHDACPAAAASMTTTVWRLWDCVLRFH
jgi:hypothetical protein